MTADHHGWPPRGAECHRVPPSAIECHLIAILLLAFLSARYDDNLLFDALWADPHGGLGVKVGSSRGAFSATFGSDVTKDFCARNGVKSIVRSHQLPKQRRGFEIQHDSMLLTIFSASNYGGACRNKGGVLIFDEHGPAEVKEFYAPQLEQVRLPLPHPPMASLPSSTLPPPSSSPSTSPSTSSSSSSSSSSLSSERWSSSARPRRSKGSSTCGRRSLYRAALSVTSASSIARSRT